MEKYKAQRFDQKGYVTGDEILVRDLITYYMVIYGSSSTTTIRIIPSTIEKFEMEVEEKANEDRL